MSREAAEALVKMHRAKLVEELSELKRRADEALIAMQQSKTDLTLIVSDATTTVEHRSRMLQQAVDKLLKM